MSTAVTEVRTPPDVGETPRVRWKRRAVSIPVMLALTAVAVLASPFIAAGLAIVDLVRGRPKLPRLRIYGVALQYLVNDSVEILLAPLLWVQAGFGTRLDSRASQRRHARLQRWSLDLLARRADRLLGLRLETGDLTALTPAPAIVLVRHVSLIDPSLASVLYSAELGCDVRGVIMAEMLADPGFDLLYGRLGSVFINRDSGDQARSAIHGLAGGLDQHSVGVIYPEGRLFNPGLRDAIQQRLVEKDPERGARVAGLRHVLPPRPGGTLAMLDGAPDADVVVIAHVGFESIPNMEALSHAAPVDHAIRVSVRRIPRSQVPAGGDEAIAWLDQVWIDMDNWIDDQTAPPSG